jgi:hypothetical protein
MLSGTRVAICSQDCEGATGTVVHANAANATVRIDSQVCDSGDQYQEVPIGQLIVLCPGGSQSSPATQTAPLSQTERLAVTCNQSGSAPSSSFTPISTVKRPRTLEDEDIELTNLYHLQRQRVDGVKWSPSSASSYSSGVDRRDDTSADKTKTAERPKEKVQLSHGKAEDATAARLRTEPSKSLMHVRQHLGLHSSTQHAGALQRAGAVASSSSDDSEAK